MLERNFLAHIKLGVLLALLAFSILLHTRLMEEEEPDVDQNQPKARSDSIFYAATTYHRTLIIIHLLISCDGKFTNRWCARFNCRWVLWVPQWIQGPPRDAGILGEREVSSVQCVRP